MTDRKSDCEELQELVTEYLEHVLRPDELRWFEGHVGRCGGCGEHLGQIQAIIDAMHHMGPERVSPEARTKLQAIFESWRAQRS